MTGASVSMNGPPSICGLSRLLAAPCPIRT
jgi:hypothetical protein